MMRAATFAWIFVLCLIRQEVLGAAPPVPPPAPVYETKTFVTNRNGLNTDNGYQIIQYKIKTPSYSNRQAGSPVFYGIGGRGSVDDVLAQYKFFDKQFTDLGNKDTITPTVVFVEQRYFGKSDTIGKITTHTDLVDLNLDNIVNDHIALIKQLSNDLQTKSFLVFGGNYGGLIAGYIADKIAKDDTLKKNYNVLAWSSSPPLKYINQDGTDLTGTALQEITTKLSELLTSAGCAAGDMAKFKRLYDGIRAYTTTDQTIVDALNLTPAPGLNPPRAGGGIAATNDLRELIVYIRKNIINLTFNNNPYDLSTGKYQDRKLKKLCDAIKLVDTAAGTALPAAKVNAVLAVFDSRPKIDNWQLSKAGGTLEKSLAATYYQDCTQLQLIYCAAGSTDTTNPILGSQWNDVIPACTTLDEYKAIVLAECQGLFGNTLDPAAAAFKNTYPRTLKNRVITTINKDSIFGKSIARFGDSDKDEKSFSNFWELSGVDGWEFQAPLSCDTAKAKDIRYLTLKAFGCMSGFVDNYKAVCDTSLFNDDALDSSGKAQPYDDTPPTGECPADTSDKSKFPFGHAALDIVNPINPPSHQTTPTTSTASTKKTVKTVPTVKTTPKVITTTPNGAGPLFSTTCILFSSLFVWFTAGSLM